MSDVITVAQQRLKNYTKAIATKEAEIAELKELMGDLESFIEFGEALVGNAPAAAAPATVKAVSRPINQEKPSVDDQEWGDEEPAAKDGIARVLSKRTG